MIRPPISAVPRLAEAVAAAMFDDPLHRYFFPDPRRRRRVLGTLYRLGLRQELCLQRLFASSEALVAVAVWEPPVGPAPPGYLSPGRVIARLVKELGEALSEDLPLAVRLGAGSLLRMFGYLRHSARERRRHTGRPHWHLSLLAVDPRHQGRGHASALVRPVLARADEEGLACYLETQNQANLALYARFGFRVAARTRISGSPVYHWSLVRPARQSRRSSPAEIS